MTEIIKSTIVHPGELTEFPANSNTHPSGNIAELAESRRQFSQYKNAVVWSPPEEMTITLASGETATLKPGIRYVLAGNGLHQASLKRRDAEIEVKDYSHLTYEQAVLLAEADNASALGSKIDPQQMQANLERARALYVDNERMAGMLERAKRLAGANGAGVVEDVEPQIDRAEELRQRYGVETGQAWELGEHRLACGDCTDRAVVEAVMRGKKVDMVFTDPPYNVQIDYGTYKDDLSSEKLETFTRAWFDMFRGISDQLLFTPGTGRGLGHPNFQLWYRIAPPDWIICWIKKNAVVHSSLGGFNNWEPIFFYGKPKKTIQQDIYDVPITVQSDVADGRGNKLHPTPKQVRLWTEVISDFTGKADVVSDPFLGSGTTLIACEQLNRRCRAIEIDPGYVAVSIHRWQQLTGLEPKLIT